MAAARQAGWEQEVAVNVERQNRRAAAFPYSGGSRVPMSDSGQVDAGEPEQPVQEQGKVAAAKADGPVTAGNARREPVLPPGDAVPLRPASAGRGGAGTTLV